MQEAAQPRRLFRTHPTRWPLQNFLLRHQLLIVPTVALGVAALTFPLWSESERRYRATYAFSHRFYPMREPRASDPYAKALLTGITVGASVLHPLSIGVPACLIAFFAFAL